jgi:hypothetical protein
MSVITRLLKPGKLQEARDEDTNSMLAYDAKILSVFT